MKSIVSLACLMVLFFLPSMARGQESDLQVVLEKLDAGESVENMTINLGDINFATGTAALEPGAKAYLEKVAKLLEAAPNLNLYIKGHTDNTGSAAVNDKLSADRAKSVMDYLTGRGVGSGRVQSKGFGSSMPIADNSTPEGRARNRRVEMEILRNTEAKTIQDIIVLIDGTRMGTTVKRYNDSEVVYVQFSTEGEQTVPTELVERIIFADGREVVFHKKEDSPISSSPVKKRKYFRPFAESEAFHKGQFFLGLGYGIKNNIGIRYKTSQVQVPPSLLIVEVPLGYNVGAGLSAGAMMWKPKNGSSGSYGYYALSPRLAYHFNLGPKFDLFFGASLNVRMGTLQGENPAGEPVLLTKFKVNGSLLGGARYYFGRFFGLFAEYGGDSVSCAKAGLAFRFGR